MSENYFNIVGLTDQEVIGSRKKNGSNRIISEKINPVKDVLRNFFIDPRILLLLAASFIYFLNSKKAEGFFLLAAVVPVTLLAFFRDPEKVQHWKSFRIFAQPVCKVMRNGKIVPVLSEEVVIGDYLLIEEGTAIAADGYIVHSLDFSVNEEIITGDAEPLHKGKDTKDNKVYHGTKAASGFAYVKINAIGNETMLGKLGLSPDRIKADKTPLEINIDIFVQKMFITSIFAFIIVFIINYYNVRTLSESLLNALPIAMSIIPLEIPAAFTTFMSLGYLRLLNTGIVAKQMNTIELLGSTSALCTEISSLTYSTGKDDDDTESDADPDPIYQRKKSLQSVFEEIQNAGIDIKIITGEDSVPEEIAGGSELFSDIEKHISGNQLAEINDTDLLEKISGLNIFTGMMQRSKLRIIKALKDNNEIVMATGTKLNDLPVMTAADIGIALGSKVSEIIKQSASLIIFENDPAKITEAIAMGRSIYGNLKKSILHIITIHIPVILTVFIPLAIGWRDTIIFKPVHIILIELIIGPTCALIYENEPAEKNTMLEKPRSFISTLFEWKELKTGVIHGVTITLGLLFSYLYAADQGLSEEKIRTIVFLTLISANIFLALVNRSFTVSIFKTLKYKNNMVLIVVCLTIFIISLVLLVKSFAVFFEFENLSRNEFLFGIMSGCVSVIWFEMVKFVNRNQTVKADPN